MGLTPANVPEASVTEALVADLSVQQVPLAELHIDRAYLSSTLVRERPPDLAIYCKAWPVRNGTRFPKTAFVLDWEQQRLRCPEAGGDGLRARRIGALPSGDLRRLPGAGALHEKYTRAQREHPSR